MINSHSLKLSLILFFTGVSFGLYLGATKMNEIHKEEKTHNQRVISNCLEVIIGKREGSNICQK
jgi:hypothetical protein